jgi:hypothetical protein
MRREDRQFFALWLVMVWLLGFELLPAAHLASHAWLAPHHHGVPGEQDGRHCHGEACHAHAGSTESPGDAPQGSAWAASGGRAHGVGTLAHRGMAAQPTTVHVPPVLEAQARLVPAPRPWSESAPQASVRAARARGPPMTPNA